MKLYIETRDGQTVNHPAFEDNLIQALGSIPDNWEPFARVERPVPDVYEVLESNEPTYQKIDGVWTDGWVLRPMTHEEKLAKQKFIMDSFASIEQAENWSAWAFDEETCTMQPPVPMPPLDATKISQGIFTFWSGADNNWKDTPVRPEGNYKFDFLAWVWVEVTE